MTEESVEQITNYNSSYQEINFFEKKNWANRRNFLIQS